MATPSLFAATSLDPVGSGGALTTSNATLVNNAAASGKAIKVVNLTVSNVDGTNDATVTIKRFSQDDSGGTGTAIGAATLNVPAQGSVPIITENNPVWLEEDTSIGGLASANGDIEYEVDYLEYS